MICFNGTIVRGNGSSTLAYDDGEEEDNKDDNFKVVTTTSKVLLGHILKKLTSVIIDTQLDVNTDRKLENLAIIWTVYFKTPQNNVNLEAVS